MKAFKDTSLPQNTVAKTTSETVYDVSDKLRDKSVKFQRFIAPGESTDSSDVAQILVNIPACDAKFKSKRTSAVAPARRRDWAIKCSR